MGFYKRIISMAMADRRFNRHLSSCLYLDEAVEAATAIEPKVAVSVHRRGMSAEEFREKLEARSDIKVLAIEPGDELDP